MASYYRAKWPDAPRPDQPGWHPDVDSEYRQRRNDAGHQALLHQRVHE